MSIENTLWIDLETTGLDPANGVILEVGMEVVTPNFDSVETFNEVCGWPSYNDSEFNALMVPAVLAQHTRSGLMKRVRESKVTWDKLCVQIREFVQKHFPEGKVIICGNSIHFDRKWLDYHLPSVTSLFHYRMIDVSSIREAIRIFGSPHRAMDDIRESRDKLKQILGKLYG